jgi:hypothetical protein
MHTSVGLQFMKCFFLSLETHPPSALPQNRRRLRRFIIPGSQALSLLSRDLREAHLQVLLGGGGQRSSDNSSSSSATNISADPLLSSFGLGFPTSDAEQASKSTVSIPDDATTVKEAPAQARKLRYILYASMLK